MPQNRKSVFCNPISDVFFRRMIQALASSLKLLPQQKKENSPLNWERCVLLTKTEKKSNWLVGPPLGNRQRENLKEKTTECGAL